MMSFVKHPIKDLSSTAGEDGGVEVVEVEEEVTNNSSRSNNEEEHVCTSDINSINEDFVDQAADDPDEVDEQSEVEEDQSHGQSGLNNEEESAVRSDANSNVEHDDDQGELEGPAKESDHHGEVQNHGEVLNAAHQRCSWAKGKVPCL